MERGTSGLETEEMKKDNQESFWGDLWREALVALSLGWELALPIFAGVLIGHFLDRWLGTGLDFTLGLLVLGIGLGYYSLARFIQRVDRRDRPAAPPDKTKNNDQETETNR